jgi:hypothetical protein
LQTKGFGPGEYELVLRIGSDPADYTVRFRIR